MTSFCVTVGGLTSQGILGSPDGGLGATLQAMGAPETVPELWSLTKLVKVFVLIRLLLLAEVVLLARCDVLSFRRYEFL